jgi:hypothetical protein
MIKDELIRSLRSRDVSTRIAALDQAALKPAQYAQHVVALIPLFPEDAYFVLERVGRFDPFIIPHLIELANSEPDGSIRLLTTLGLAHFRQPVDTDLLLKAIREHSKYQYLACKALAWLGDPVVLPELEMELQKTSATSDWDRLVSLVVSIEELGGEIPQSERDRLIAEGPPLTPHLLSEKRAD